MASGDKSAKTQLISIYRLEFYKNKKNWKLYEDVRKEPPAKVGPIVKVAQFDSLKHLLNKLNKTYNVGEEFPESEYDVEQVSPHNKAFLGEEPALWPTEDGPDPQPPDEPASPPASAHNLYRPHSWPEQPWSGEKTDVLCQDAPQEWCGAGVEPGSMPEELAYDQCDGHQHNLWTPAPDLELRPAADALDQLLQSTEDWMQRHGYPLRKECPATNEEYGLVDEIADFMRGAHEASHSSEIDLSVTPDCPCSYDGLLYMLSERQLARAVQRHHCALVHLLGEQALRERPYSHSHLHLPVPFEDCPTRDTDPFRPDVVLSGSHAMSGTHAVPGLHGAVSGLPLTPDTGRGRGRLHRTHRVIGIGMGRPYRL